MVTCYVQLIPERESRAGGGQHRSEIDSGWLRSLRWLRLRRRSWLALACNDCKVAVVPDSGRVGMSQSLA